MGHLATSPFIAIVIGTILLRIIIPIALVVWAARTLIMIRRSQSEILQRLAAIESQHDALLRRP